ncbi:Mobile element protein [Azospirillum doebereinerae]
MLEGRGQRRIATGHRTQPPPPNSQTPRAVATPATQPPGDTVTPRSLAIYDAIGRRLAGQPEAVR